MSARTFSLTNTLADASGAPAVGRTVTATLLVPGGVPATDPSAPAALVPDSLSTTTDSSGAYSLTLTYPGDLTPVGAGYVVVEAGTAISSPPAFAYAANIAAPSWYPAAGPAGTLPCRLLMRRADGAPVTGRRVHVTPQQTTTAPDASVLSVFSSVDVALDSDGAAVCWLWPSSLLSPITLYTARIDGEAAKLSFSVPTAPIGDAGAWDAGTAYHVNSATAVAPSDVVTHGGVRYVAVADSTGQTPPNATYWALWPGEPLLWHLVPFGLSAAIPAPSTVIGHTAAVLPTAGAPEPTPATLADDLANLVFALAAAATLAFRHVTADVTLTNAAQDAAVLADATGGAVTITLPSAINCARRYTIKRLDGAAHTVTIATSASQTIDGASTKSLATQYAAATLVSDNANWFLAAVI